MWREFEDSASKTVVCRLATDRYTDTHTDTQTHRYTDTQTYRQTDRTDYMIVANLRLATIKMVSIHILLPFFKVSLNALFRII